MLRLLMRGNRSEFWRYLVCRNTCETQWYVGNPTATYCRFGVYPDQDGVGGSSGGMEWSVELNEWDNRGVEVQGFGNGNVGDTGSQYLNPSPQVKGLSEVFFRVGSDRKWGIGCL